MAGPFSQVPCVSTAVELRPTADGRTNVCSSSRVVFRQYRFLHLKLQSPCLDNLEFLIDDDGTG